MNFMEIKKDHRKIMKLAMLKTLHLSALDKGNLVKAQEFLDKLDELNKN